MTMYKSLEKEKENIAKSKLKNLNLMPGSINLSFIAICIGFICQK